MVYLLEINREACCVTGIVEPASSRPNIIITLQELEYLLGINFGRRVQSFMGWLLIVPGSLSLYRSYVLKALAKAPDDTVAEDFDLTVTAIKKGLKAVFDPYSRSYTKPAVSLGELYKQRLRWFYGGLQVLAKHRDILLNRRYGAVGIASFFYLLLVEYGLPFLQVAGYIVFPLILILQGILHVKFIELPLTGVPLLIAYLLVLFLQHIPGYIMSWILFLVEKMGLSARRLFAPLIYFTFYNIFLAIVKVVSVIKYIRGEEVVWR
jgi:cellulose synthase/poly-beta-1,6-N-acetylglucosamine synthase-like glycosyltransferase